MSADMAADRNKRPTGRRARQPPGPGDNDGEDREEKWDGQARARCLSLSFMINEPSLRRRPKETTDLPGDKESARHAIAFISAIFLVLCVAPLLNRTVWISPQNCTGRRAENCDTMRTNHLMPT